MFQSRDGGLLAGFEPGQHLPIEVNIPEISDPVRSTYSLSNGPNEDFYRITVKREPKGIASRYLHDQLEPGAIINCRPPSGEFVLNCNKCPLVLVSAGVGITPMMSILQKVANEPGDRSILFVHGARDRVHHPLVQEVRELAAQRENIGVHFAYSQPGPDDQLVTDYDSRGRIDGALMAQLTDNSDAHYFICGPAAFMGALQTDLQNQGVAAEHIHTESFGPLR